MALSESVLRWLKIIGIILAGILLLAGLIWLGVWVYKTYQRADNFEKLYTECYNAPPDTTVIYIDTAHYHNSDTIKPKPINHGKVGKVPRKPVHDSIIYRDTCFQTEMYYSEVYKKDAFQIHWEAVSQGPIKWIRFPEYTCPKEITVIEKRVPRWDTLTIYKEKSHIGLYTKLYVANFSQFPGLEFGGMYTFKGKGGVMLGGMWDSYHTAAFGTVGVFINLN